ncbi:MAG: hypothetical protein EOQ30_28195 [Mesorhizobium sp.]|uniref:hypothetical protein n=1 Tax=Mesorhizobium sp. TaxID=1871066 RepID=UPI000FE7EF0E|nr:hypothetical protein [Mesorhizobium sp.]RWA67503.1 MAG: hypothetical protein EOQ29_23675 [Mesorhizobium sp.]RWA78699.1 MAG: hypothetical protein EOQ30_28195 [Mesorhizobium sp.]TIS44991.1 MAG: hypothetical protein E5W96_33470 [Mesorhizobium sp.]
MAKKKSKSAFSAIATASRSEAAEAVHFARKCGLTPDEALRLMREAQVTPELKSPDGGKRKR